MAGTSGWAGGILRSRSGYGRERGAATFRSGDRRSAGALPSFTASTTRHPAANGVGHHRLDTGDDEYDQQDSATAGMGGGRDRFGPGGGGVDRGPRGRFADSAGASPGTNRPADAAR